jgi:hypothetical protein
VILSCMLLMTLCSMLSFGGPVRVASGVAVNSLRSPVECKEKLHAVGFLLASSNILRFE